MRKSTSRPLINAIKLCSTIRWGGWWSILFASTSNRLFHWSRWVSSNLFFSVRCLISVTRSSSLFSVEQRCTVSHSLRVRWAFSAACWLLIIESRSQWSIVYMQGWSSSFPNRRLTLSQVRLTLFWTSCSCMSVSSRGAGRWRKQKTLSH